MNLMGWERTNRENGEWPLLSQLKDNENDPYFASSGSSSEKASRIGPKKSNEALGIAQEIQRSTSAPPNVEHAGASCTPMYATETLCENQQDISLHCDYYNFYTPTIHNPRLPIPFHQWEMKKKKQQGSSNGFLNGLMGSLDDVSGNGDSSSTPFSTDDKKYGMGKIREESRVASPVHGTYLSTQGCDTTSSTLESQMQNMILQGETSYEKPVSIISPFNNIHQRPAEVTPFNELNGQGHYGGDNIRFQKFHPSQKFEQHPQSQFQGPFSHSSNDYSQGMYHNQTTKGDGNFGHKYFASNSNPQGSLHQDYNHNKYLEARLSQSQTQKYQHNNKFNGRYYNSLGQENSASGKNGSRGIKNYPKSHSPLSSGSGSSSVERSQLLLEFDSIYKTQHKWNLSSITGYALEFGQDQHGSRFIQSQLDIASISEKECFFVEVLPHTYTLMTNVFGNYIIQKFLEFGSFEQRNLLAESMRGKILEIALQTYGCRVLQKALEVIEPKQKNVLIGELKGYILKLVKDQNGNHVIQRIIELVDWKNNNSKVGGLSIDNVHFILDEIYGQVFVLSTHQYGCRVIQRVLDHCSYIQCLPIIKEINHSCFGLVVHQYGNYVVQHVITHGIKADVSALISRISSNIAVFSKQKFASNVIEKCLIYAEDSERHGMVLNILYGDNSEAISPLDEIIKDQFGNYVIQKMIEVASNSDRMLMIECIHQKLFYLKQFTYGKHIIALLEKKTGHRIS